MKRVLKYVLAALFIWCANHFIKRLSTQNRRLTDGSPAYGQVSGVFEGCSAASLRREGTVVEVGLILL